MANLRANLQHFPTTRAYLSGFEPVVVKKTLTDADGRFSITCPRGKAFTIYATAQRQVMQSTERYCWLVNAPTNSETGQLFLSNGSLSDVDPDGYFKIKPREPQEALEP
jgi:hypothetical protein